MTTYISMLRGINVSGQKKIKIDDLKALYESLGFKNVKTYIQSGNIIFESSDLEPTELINKIENKIKQSYGFFVRVLIRTKDELQKVLENNPFYGNKKVDTSKLHVTFLSEAPVEYNLEYFEKIKDPSEKCLLSEKEVYLFCPNGYGRTKLTNNLYEKKLKVSATTRNWNTVNKLYELVNT